MKLQGFYLRAETVNSGTTIALFPKLGKTPFFQ
jgi:hypothetical protein